MLAIHNFGKLKRLTNNAQIRSSLKFLLIRYFFKEMKKNHHKNITNLNNSKRKEFITPCLYNSFYLFIPWVRTCIIFQDILSNDSFVLNREFSFSLMRDIIQVNLVINIDIYLLFTYHVTQLYFTSSDAYNIVSNQSCSTVLMVM